MTPQRTMSRAKTARIGAGYTRFAINHRAAPGFRYPAAVEDAQRAVRFVRHHAKDEGATNAPDYLREMVRWFDRHLRAGR